MATDAAFAGGDELEKLFGGLSLHLGPQFIQGIGHRSLPAKYSLVNGLKFLSVTGRHPRASQAYGVYSAEAVDSGDRGERWHIHARCRSSLHESQGSNAHELVDKRVPRKEGAVGNLHVSADECAVCKNVMVANETVVTDMAVGHKKIVAAYDGVFVRLIGVMDGDVFPKNVVITNSQACRFAVVFDILRGVADDRTSVELVALANGGLPGEMDMGGEGAVGTQRDSSVDDCVWPDYGSLMYVGSGVNDGGWVNVQFPILITQGSLNSQVSNFSLILGTRSISDH